MSPRIPALSDDAVPPAAAPLLDRVRAALGVVPNLHRTLAHSPAALRAYTTNVQSLAAGTLDPKLRERIAVAVARANRCGYCASAHTVLGKAAGLDDDELRVNLDGHSFESRSDAAMRFALRLLETRGAVGDDDVAAVRRAGFGDAELVEIVAHVAMNTFTNLLNVFARTELDFPPVALPDAA